MNELLENVSRIHASEMAKQRLRANLDLIRTDPEIWVRDAVRNPEARIRKSGKKWYVELGSAIVTIYDGTFAILTGERKKEDHPPKAQILDQEFCICKTANFSQVDQNDPFVFCARTDREYSVICPCDRRPANILEGSSPWRCFRLGGTGEVAVIGSLSELTKILTQAKIGLFCVSTFSCDYIFVPGRDWERTEKLLRNHQYL